MGKRKVLSEANLKELVKPEQGEFLGRVLKLTGGDLVIVKCADGQTRVCRIRGSSSEGCGYGRTTSFWYLPGISITERQTYSGVTSGPMRTGSRPTTISRISDAQISI